MSNGYIIYIYAEDVVVIVDVAQSLFLVFH